MAKPEISNKMTMNFPRVTFRIKCVKPHLGLQPIVLRMLFAISFLFAAIPAKGGAEKIIDVTKNGVVGDGSTLNTINLQKAIDDCAAGGGGVIDFPTGRYLTGTIQLKSNVTLRFEDQAILLGSTNAADYRNLDPFVDGNGSPMGYALIIAVDADHVGIEGGGTVDGQGPKLKTKEHPFTVRPFLMRWVRCTDVTVKDVHLTNPGAWTLHFSQSKGAVVDGVTIRTRETKLTNNDGIDIDSSENVQVRNCDIDSEDDAIVIKSTNDAPSRNIVASGCKLSSHTNAIKLGTESFGGFEDISISKCQILNTDMAGIALYEVDGADLHHVMISDVTIDGVSLPISIRLGSRLKTFREDQKAKPAAGQLSDVTIKNVSAKNVKMIGMLINGVPDHPVENVTLENIRLEVPGGGTPQAAKVTLGEKEAAYPEFNMFGKTMPAYGIYARHVRGIKLQDVQVSPLKPDARPATVFIDVEDISPPDFVTQSPIGK
jgi:polygalacturonase